MNSRITLFIHVTGDCVIKGGLRLKRIAVLLLIMLVLASCAVRPSEPQNPLIQWLEDAKLDARETPEELYAAALKEDTLVVYSTSTRMMDTAKSFEKHYTGLTVKVEDIREGELYDMLQNNYETENFDCDVICSADGRGILTNEFLPKMLAVKYVPYDISNKILPGNNEDTLMLAGEAPMLQYNDVYYPQPPVSNWWELTGDEWRGKVYMPNPVRSVTTMAFLSMIVKHSDMMAKAYEELYGTSLEMPEDAGRTFIRRLAENDVILVNSSDEVADAIGLPGSNSPYLGIMISSKARLRDIGYEMTIHYDMEPFCGVYTPINIMMAGGSRNVNTAKLFIRWLLGETDGQGEGYKPYLQSGAWSVRSDVRDDTGVRSEELNLLYMDRAYMYEHKDDMLVFWEELIGQRG